MRASNIFAIAVIIAKSVICYKLENNVCKTLHDYYFHIESNPNCYHNPDVYLSVPEIIEKHSYPVQVYKVTTDDGYILTVFRIPHGRNSTNKQLGPPVFIQHGLAVSSMVFVNSGERSLADSGYDVWLGNFRGSQYSDQHISISNSNKKYWDFSFHENGVYDTRSQLDLIKNVTDQKTFYIGYSMGSTSYFIYNSEFPNLAQETIKFSISMAPIAFLNEVETPLAYLIPIWPLVKAFLDNEKGGVFNKRTGKFVADRAKRCLPKPKKMEACLAFGYLLFGYDKTQEDVELLPVVTMQDIDSMSTKTVDHYVQLVTSGAFAKYNYGEDLNSKIYGQKKPPDYNLSGINVPNYFIRANKDQLATKKNVYKTYMAFSASVKPFDVYLVNWTSFVHSDFIVAKNVKELVYDHIVRLLHDYNNIL